MLQAFNPLQDLLRQLSMNGQMGNSPTSPDMAVSGLMPQQSDPTDLMNPSPQDAQFEQFVNLINSMPRRENYEPTKFRKTMAAIAGLGAGGPAAYSGGAALGYKSDIPTGLKVQRSIMEEPYDKAMNDWTDKAKPTLESAKLENTKNVNERVGLNNVRTAEIKDRSLKRQIDWDSERAHQADVKALQADRKIDISAQRADAYQYRIEHPNKILKESDDGKLIAVDPQSGVAEIVKDTDGNEIETGKLDDRTKLALQLQNRLTAIKSQGSETRKTEEVRQDNRKELESTRQTNRLGVIEKRNVTKPKGETPAQRKVRLYNNAAEALNKHSEWKNYIKLSPGNNFVISIPEGKTGLFGYGKTSGGNAEVAQKINDFIYGDSDTADKSEIESVETKTETKIPDSQGRIIITDGTKNFTLPASQVDAYIKLHPEFKRGRIKK